MVSTSKPRGHRFKMHLGYRDFPNLMGMGHDPKILGKKPWVITVFRCMTQYLLVQGTDYRKIYI